MSFGDSVGQKAAEILSGLAKETLPDDMKQGAALLQAVIDHAINSLAGKRIVITIEEKA